VGRLTPALVAALVRLPTLVERSRSVDNDVSLLLARHWSFASNVAGERVQFVAQILSRTPMEVVADFYPTFTSHDGFAGLAEFHGRELLVVGARQDRITPIRHSRAIAEALPEAEYVELDPSGHLAMIEHPDRVGAAIDDLLDRAGAAWTKRIGAGEADR